LTFRDLVAAGASIEDHTYDHLRLDNVHLDVTTPTSTTTTSAATSTTTTTTAAGAVTSTSTP
jgi:hypothetical protein